LTEEKILCEIVVSGKLAKMRTTLVIVFCLMALFAISDAGTTVTEAAVTTATAAAVTSTTAATTTHSGTASIVAGAMTSLLAVSFAAFFSRV